MKPFKETEDLVALLNDRGLNIDRPDMAAFLHDFNYYRFTGYARQYQQNPNSGDNEFLPGTKASDIHAVIELDAELRGLLQKALTVVEMSVRARYAHEAGRAFGEKAFYLDRENYLPVTPDLDRLIESMTNDLRRSKSPSVARYVETDSFEKVPIWVAVEVLSFGAIAKMLMYIADDRPARQVAASYSLAWEGFQSTIHAFSVLRNLCAHHNQIWHRKPAIQTPVLKKLRPRNIKYDHQGNYPAIVMLKVYLKAIQPGSHWAFDIDALLTISPTFMAGILEPYAK